MAYSYIQIPADGSTNTFNVPCLYISKSHVTVTVDGVATTFTWPTLSTVTLTDTAASLAGKIVEIRRTTPRTAPLVNFQDAANVTEAMLDLSVLQQFYIAQEVLDDNAGKLTLASDGSYDALTHKIKNLANGVLNQDAVTMAQLLAAAIAPLTPIAANIAFTPTGTLVGVNVQAALAEAAIEADAKVTKHAGVTDNLAILAASGEISDSGISKLIRYESVRQTVVAGAVDSNGQANFLSAGTGLAVSMAATTTPVVATFAAGEDEYGQKNFRKRFTATEADYFAGLAASNLSYLMLERDATTAAVSAYKTLVPPQYGAFFDKTKQAQLNFATDFSDSYGNTWSAVGNAAISAGKLALDGSGDGLRNTTILSLGSGSWTVEGDYTFTALPGVGAAMEMFYAANAGNYGVHASLYNQAGVLKLTIWASSTGLSWDIISAGVGTKTTWATATKYHLAMTYDAVAGYLYVYVDGVLDRSVNTAARISPVTSFTIGLDNGTANGVNGTVDRFRFSSCCRYPTGTAFTPPAADFTPDAEWFDLSEFKWKYGSPTAWTEKQRVCVGEVTTNATVPVTITTYAVQGKYVSPLVAIPASGTAQAFSHNIGIPHCMLDCRYVVTQASNGYAVGDSIPLSNNTENALAAFTVFNEGKLIAKAIYGTAIWTATKSTGAAANILSADGLYKLFASRGW